MDAPSPSPRKPFWRRWFGNRAERAAWRFLRGLGYRVVARNWTCSVGELDVVALDGQTIVFVEVRSTEGPSTERPALSVDLAKQRKLTNLALHFLQQKKLLNHAARFDVLALSWPPERGEPMIEHFPNAFEAIGKLQMFH